MGKNNNDLFDLMSKIYSEMRDIKGNFEIRFDKLENKVDNLEIRFDKLENKVDSLEEKMDKRFDNLTSDIGNLVSRDIAEGISNQIEDVKSDIKFLTHKTQETEKDVYKIQNYLKIIK